MPHAHDRAVLGVRRQSRASGGSGSRDDERVIAPGGERLRDAAEDARAVVLDGRRLAVHQLGRADDVAAEGDADALVPEADAEHRDARRRTAGSPRPRSRRPRAVRARARSRCDRAACSATSSSVSSSLRRTSRRRAQLAEVLGEVEGERIVVVDQQNHSPASAMASACSSARALSRVSSYSAAGFESATIPAPAWTRARPFLHRDGPNRDAEIEVAREVDVADGAGVDVAARRLELRQDLHRADLRRARHRAGRKARHERVEMVAFLGEAPIDGRHEVHDVRVPLERHVLRHADRCRTRRRGRDRSARDRRASRARRAPSRSASAPRRGADLPRRCVPRGRVPAIGCVSTRRPSTRTSISGDDPTIASPPMRMKYM